MLFGKTKEIQKLEGRIMETENVIHDLLFDKNTSNETSKLLINLLITLDREEAEFLLDEYEKIGTGKEYPKNDIMKKRYNVIGPMIKKRLAQIDSKK